MRCAKKKALDLPRIAVVALLRTHPFHSLSQREVGITGGRAPCEIRGDAFGGLRGYVKVKMAMNSRPLLGLVYVLHTPSLITYHNSWLFSPFLKM